MLDLKKTAIAVLALGCSAAFAGTMGPVCTPGSVTVPCERMAWDIGAKALYLNATGSHYNYELTNNPVGFPFGSSHAFDDNWSWGFMIEGSYHFSTGNDINVNWYHLDSDDNRAFSTGVRLPFVANPITAPFALDHDLRWDAVNFEFGQTVNFGEHKVIRFHGGAQYADINSTSTFITRGVREARAKTEFSGFGPRAGLDMSYHFGNGLAIYANAASALLIGETDFNYRLLTVKGPSSSRNTIVPELEAKLGVTYGYAMAQGDLTIDAGWMTTNYFDVLQVPGRDASNIGLNGPYIGAKWVGNAA